MKDTIEVFQMDKAISRLAGDVRIYQIVLQTYYDDMVCRKDALEKIWKNRNMKLFITYAHVIKGASLGVGAEKIAGMATKLELAGKEENITWIEKQMPIFMAELDIVIEAARLYLEKVQPFQTFTEISKTHKDSISYELLKQLAFYCDEMDYVKIEEVLKEIEKYSYKVSDQCQLQQIKDKVTQLQYEEAEELVIKFINEKYPNL